MPGYYHLRHLRKDYTPLDPAQPSALHIEQLDIPLGGIIAIVGGSGSGKTTLLNLISGLETPDPGADGEPNVLDLQLPDEAAPRHLADLLTFSRGSGGFPYDRVSYVFQQGYLLNQASIAINLAMTRRAAGFKADDAALHRLVDIAQLNGSEREGGGEKLLSDRAVTLSGGQQQRINIARALGREPALLFADELSSSLDPHKAEDVLTRLREWIWTESEQQGDADRTSLSRTMLWVTHDYHLASRFADAVVVLHQGRLARFCTSPVEFAAGGRASAAQIRQWVQQGAVPADGPVCKMPQANAVACQAAPASAGSRISRTQIALGNMGSGVALSLLEAFQQPYPSRWKVINVCKRVLRPLFGFTGWARALQLAAILALIMIITYGRQEVIRYFDEQLNDPTLRHVIVNQNMRELTASRINEQSLQSLSAQIAALLPVDSTDSSAARSAYGRFTESVDVYPRGSEDINQGFVPEITIGILDPGEPVYAEMNVHVIDPDNPSCDSAGMARPAELIPYADELVLIVSERYLTDARRMYDVDLCQSPWLDLWDVGDPRSFRIAGFVETPPADGYDRFDAVMQIDVWQTWLARMNKRQMTNLSRAAVYFNQRNYSGVIAQLEQRSFAFDQEIISKFSRLIGTSSQLRNTFLVITWLTLAVAATVAAGLIWSYLAQNAKSIAVLRAHNAWFWPLVAAIPFQLLLTFVFALIYLGLGCLLWNLAIDQTVLRETIEQLFGASWQPGKISWHLVAPTLGWLGFSFIVMIAVGLFCLILWRFTHRRLAHELRQAY